MKCTYYIRYLNERVIVSWSIYTRLYAMDKVKWFLVAVVKLYATRAHRT